jgi:hypothetical protein
MATSVAGSVVGVTLAAAATVLTANTGVGLLTTGTGVFVGASVAVAFDVGVNKAARAVDVIC